MKVLIVNFICFSLVVSNCWSQTAKEVLETMTGRLAGYEDYRVNIVANISVTGPKKQWKAESDTALSVKGKKQYSEVVGMDAMGSKVDSIRIFDGKTSWDYDRVNKVVKKVDSSRMSDDIRKKLEQPLDPADLGLLGEMDYELRREKLNGREYYVLSSIEPLTMGQQTFDSVIIWVEMKRDLLFKTEVISVIEIPVPDGSSIRMVQNMVQEFKDWEFDIGIPDYKFSLSIPEGVKVFDETDKTRKMYEMMRELEEKKKQAAENNRD